MQAQSRAQFAEGTIMLDPAIQALMKQMPELATYPMWEKSPEEARQEFKAFCSLANADVAPIGKIENIQAETGKGTIALRVYTPVAAGALPLPAIVYFHGGGFVMGDLDSCDGLCRMLANESGCRVVSVDYRLAPEHPFPAAVEDCFAAVCWVEAHGAALCIDPNRLAVAGDSAGANLAAVVTILARENNDSPHVEFQLLIYPPTKLGGIAGIRPNGEGYFLDNRTIDWFRGHYLPKDVDHNDPRLSPLDAPEVGNLPATYIVTAGFDPLHDEGAAYAEKLKRAGVKVTHADYPSMIHGFFSMPAFIPAAAEAISAAAHAVKAAINE